MRSPALARRFGTLAALLLVAPILALLLAAPDTAHATKLEVAAIDGFSAVEGAKVVVKDANGKTVKSGETSGADGNTPNAEFEVDPGTYTIEVEYLDGKGRTKTGTVKTTVGNKKKGETVYLAEKKSDSAPADATALGGVATGPIGTTGAAFIPMSIELPAFSVEVAHNFLCRLNPDNTPLVIGPFADGGPTASPSTLGRDAAQLYNSYASGSPDEFDEFAYGAIQSNLASAASTPTPTAAPATTASAPVDPCDEYRKQNRSPEWIDQKTSQLYDRYWHLRDEKGENHPDTIAVGREFDCWDKLWNEAMSGTQQAEADLREEVTADVRRIANQVFAHKISPEARDERLLAAHTADAATKGWRNFTFTGAVQNTQMVLVGGQRIQVSSIAVSREKGILANTMMQSAQLYLNEVTDPAKRAIAQEIYDRNHVARGLAAADVGQDVAVTFLGTAADVGTLALGGTIARLVNKGGNAVRGWLAADEAVAGGGRALAQETATAGATGSSSAASGSGAATAPTVRIPPPPGAQAAAGVGDDAATVIIKPPAGARGTAPRTNLPVDDTPTLLLPPRTGAPAAGSAAAAGAPTVRIPAPGAATAPTVRLPGAAAGSGTAPTVQLGSAATAPTVRLPGAAAGSGTAPTVKLGSAATAPTVRLPGAAAGSGTAPTVQLGSAATAPTVRLPGAAAGSGTAPTVRLGAGATAPTVRLGAGATAPTVKLGPGATAPTVKLGPGATAPTVKLGPGATAPTVKLGPGATAPTVKLGPGATAPTVKLGSGAASGSATASGAARTTRALETAGGQALGGALTSGQGGTTPEATSNPPPASATTPTAATPQLATVVVPSIQLGLMPIKATSLAIAQGQLQHTGQKGSTLRVNTGPVPDPAAGKGSDEGYADDPSVIELDEDGNGWLYYVKLVPRAFGVDGSYLSLNQSADAPAIEWGGDWDCDEPGACPSGDAGSALLQDPSICDAGGCTSFPYLALDPGADCDAGACDAPTYAYVPSCDAGGCDWPDDWTAAIPGCDGGACTESDFAPFVQNESTDYGLDAPSDGFLLPDGTIPYMLDLGQQIFGKGGIDFSAVPNSYLGLPFDLTLLPEVSLDATHMDGQILWLEPGTALADLPAGLQLLNPNLFAIGDQAVASVLYPADMAQQVIDWIESTTGVKLSERDKCRIMEAAPADPYFNSKGSWGQSYDDQWAIKRVGLTAASDSAWNLIPSDASRTLVAVIDTGLDWNHADVAWESLWQNPGETPSNGIDDDGNGYVDDLIGWDFIGRNNRPWDRNGHGTFVTGVIAAAHDNGLGIAGVDPNARVMVLKAMNNFGQTRASYVAEAIAYAADNGARVINLSLGGPDLTATEKLAIDYAHGQGAVVVVAAGNEAVDVKDRGPAGHPRAITVAATDLADARGAFSNFGEGIDVAAPGVDVLSLRARRTDLMTGIPDVAYEAGSAYVGDDNRYYRTGGTSFAAPIVAGVASLMLSARPELTPDQVKRMLRESARDVALPGVDLHTGYGLIDARAALRADPSFFVSADIARVEVVQVDGRPVVRVHGTADADRLEGAILEIGRGENPDRFAPVRTLEKGIQDGVLGEFDASKLSGSKVWILRLRTRHQDGTERQARFRVGLG